ncbi:hypothetical protein, partial [Anaplasma marginale]|uniref:hypothetical protein n=1 Tax=Anaplasma marginale TaxID=770 RepID=UPI0005B39D3A
MDVKLLNEIEYGPFKAKYHQENTNLEFKEALINFLRDNIVPQVTIKFDRVEGNLLAVYDEDIYCGSHSLVKNIYDLDLSFIKGEENEFLREDIVYNPKLISFSVRGKRKLYLWTVERQKKAKYKEIKNICISFLEEDIILV